ASCSASRVPAGNTRDAETPSNQSSHAQGEGTKKEKVIAAAEYPPPADAHPHRLDKAASPERSNRRLPLRVAPPMRHPEPVRRSPTAAFAHCRATPPRSVWLHFLQYGSGSPWRHESRGLTR